VRTTGDPEALVAAVRAEVHKLAASLPLYEARTMEAQLDRALANDRMIASLSLVFGMLATLLAMIGLYGVMSYTVARRTREIGVRVAFGASTRDISWLVLREVLLIAAAGVAVGLPLAWWLGRFVSAQLYGVKPGDPLTIASAVMLLTGIALLAGLLPALRAARLAPTLALRHD
jgi:ABC-type antimicrobial peptide transport system permease subunit